MIVIIYKDGKEVDRGIYTGGKHWCKDYPDQSVSICDSCDAYSIENERTYEHGNGISFKELQGTHVAYDSNTREDNTKEYPLPNWMIDGKKPIPNYYHELDENGDEITTKKGIVR